MQGYMMIGRWARPILTNENFIQLSSVVSMLMEYGHIMSHMSYSYRAIAFMEWAPWQDGTWSAESKYDGTLLCGYSVDRAYSGEVTLTPGQIRACLDVETIESCLKICTLLWMLWSFGKVLWEIVGDAL